MVDLFFLSAAFLFHFGEIQSRIVVSFAEENESKLYDACNSHGVDFLMLGHVGTSKFTLKDVIAMPMDTLENIWKSGLDSLINDVE